eukprot:TRINITY_DN7010_c0_g1_i1.p1 TRINITY_DN7010_c0_g1~~TRINITY_DN7010_c0_g1_i1.p1  ORF type:complete len:57 (+),score=4.75 TRINITY_DN7010_c0_g1_i1:331-501(+)
MWGKKRNHHNPFIALLIPFMSTTKKFGDSLTRQVFHNLSLCVLEKLLLNGAPNSIS